MHILYSDVSINHRAPAQVEADNAISSAGYENKASGRGPSNVFKPILWLPLVKAMFRYQQSYETGLRRGEPALTVRTRF